MHVHYYDLEIHLWSYVINSWSYAINSSLLHQLIYQFLSTCSSMQKRKGDKGSICLTHLGQLKNPSSLPLIRMDSFNDLEIVRIQLKKKKSDSNLFRTLRKKCHTNMSYISLQYQPSIFHVIYTQINSFVKLSISISKFSY